MESSLRERFARLGPIRAIDRVTSGSPATFVLSLPPGHSIPQTIDGTVSLARRGMTLLKAKQVIEALVEIRRVVVGLPIVEDPEILATELAEAGITAELAAGESARYQTHRA
jgi:putative transcriptional regulator